MCLHGWPTQREAHNWRNEAKGPDANHKHFSCPAKSPVGEGLKNRGSAVTFAYDPYHPDAVSLLDTFLSVCLGERWEMSVAALQLWPDFAPLSSFPS